MPLTLDVVFDYIIHAASNADPKMYALQPAETIITNVIGTKMCLNTVRKHRYTVAVNFNFRGLWENRWH